MGCRRVKREEGRWEREDGRWERERGIQLTCEASSWDNCLELRVLNSISNNKRSVLESISDSRRIGLMKIAMGKENSE